MVNKMVKAMHKNGVLLSEEIYRIKELFGNDFKPVIKEQRKIIKEPRKVIKEQREIIARRVFNLDLSIPAPAQVAKIRRYLTELETENGMFIKYSETGVPIYPYEALGWRSSNDFMADITTAANPNLTNAERAIEIERVIRQLDIKDAAKFEAKVKVGAKSLLDLELRTEGSAFRTDLETAITEVLESAVESALNVNPNMTRQGQIDFVNTAYDIVKAELIKDLGDNANLFDQVALDFKERIRQDENIVDDPLKPKLPRSVWARISEVNFLRIRQVFEEIRKFGLGVTPEGNIQDTNRLLEQIRDFNMSPKQRQAIFERIRQNIASVISGDATDLAHFKEAVKAVDAAIDGLDLPAVTKAELKSEYKLKATLNFLGSSVGEKFNWVTQTEEDLRIAHNGGNVNPMATYQYRFTGNLPGAEKIDWGAFFGNIGKRLLNISIFGQARFFSEIGADTRSYRGGTRRRFFKTYMYMLLVKFLLLPIVELFWNIPIQNVTCKRWKKKREDMIKLFEDAKADATDMALIDKALPMPKGCDVTMNSGLLGQIWQVYLMEANSIPGTIRSFFKIDPSGNYLGTKQDWAITVENTFDLLNPFSTLIDDAKFLYSYQDYDAMTEEVTQKLIDQTDKIKKRVAQAEEDFKKSQRELREKIKELQTNKDFIKDTQEVPLTITTYVKVEKNRKYILEQIKPENWNTARNCYVISDPLDFNVTYDITQHGSPFGYQVRGNGKTWVKNEKERVSGDSGTLEDFAAYYNQRVLDSVPTEPIKAESRYKKTNNMITERNKEKFGEDNFKHWKDTFTFKAQDDKNPGQYKEVKIKMEDVMDRINHYRKKYDEDDSFVRAVIDTHEDVVKIMFTKDLANIHESATPRGLALVLRVIKESRGEMEIFSVARPANGNWFLVKGDYTPNQLANMDLEKKEPQTKETEVNSKSEDDLKKKEESAINVLKRNEKEGIEDLPKKIRDKVREKMGKGWTTETPPEELKEYFTTSEINSIFNDKIVIYKLEPTKEFFNNLVKFSARIVIKRGFCRTLKSGKNEIELGERQKMTVNHILNKCNTKYESKLGLRNF
jgi:hypothetical protein